MFPKSKFLSQLGFQEYFKDSSPPRDAWRISTLSKTPKDALRDLPKTPEELDIFKALGDAWSNPESQIYSGRYEIT